jgi:hypothetical protein
MGLMLGGERCWKKRRVSGGLMVFYEWFEGEGTMFIAREQRFALSGNRGSAAIAQPQAYLYADSKTGAPTKRLILFAAQACKALSLESSRQNIRVIADAIVDGLEDLLRMPPEPDEKKFTGKPDEPMGEMTLLDSSGRELVSSEIH